jgi:inosine/xanthosine triphosphate pyrophosphatase family protein
METIMSEQTNILVQVQNEIRSAKVKETKTKLKALVEEYNKAEDVRKGVEQKIVALLEDSGLSQDEITGMLSA